MSSRRMSIAGAQKFGKKSVGCAHYFFLLRAPTFLQWAFLLRISLIFGRTVIFLFCRRFFCVFLVVPTLPPTIIFFRAHNTHTPTPVTIFFP